MNFEQIIRQGRYFFPASKRYPSGSAVICDRCNTRGLQACIGHQSFDLCLKCASQVESAMRTGHHNPLIIGPPTHITRHDPWIRHSVNSSMDTILAEQSRKGEF